MKKIIALSVSLILVLLLMFFSPYIVEKIYLNNKTTDNLYLLCNVSGFLKNKNLIFEYYPQLVFNDDNNFLSKTEKDKLLYEYLDTAIEFDDFEKQKEILRNTYLEFSEIEDAMIGSFGFIFSYYEKTNNKENTCELFEVLLDASSDKDYEYKDSVYSKYISFLIDNNEMSLVKELREERIEFLKNNGVDIWDDDQSGDGSVSY